MRSLAFAHVESDQEDLKVKHPAGSWAAGPGVQDRRCRLRRQQLTHKSGCALGTEEGEVKEEGRHGSTGHTNVSDVKKLRNGRWRRRNQSVKDDVRTSTKGEGPLRTSSCWSWQLREICKNKEGGNVNSNP